MPAVVREVVSIGLFVLLISSTLGAVLNLARAEQLPRSETARRVMEHERENEPALGYFPEASLLSEQGRIFRRRGTRLAQLAALTLAIYAVFYFAVGPR